MNIYVYRCKERERYIYVHVYMYILILDLFHKTDAMVRICEKSFNVVVGNISDSMMLQILNTESEIGNQLLEGTPSTAQILQGPTQPRLNQRSLRCQGIDIQDLQPWGSARNTETRKHRSLLKHQIVDFNITQTHQNQIKNILLEPSDVFLPS